MSGGDASESGSPDVGAGGDGDPPGDREPSTRARSPVDAPTNVWTRWDTAGRGRSGNDGFLPIDDLHLHRYCSVPPFGNRERGLNVSRSDERVRFLDGPVRTGLEYTPVVVAAAVAVLLVGAELSPRVQGISAFLPELPLVAAPAAVLFAVVWGVLVWLLLGVGLLERDELAKAVVVYGLVGALAVGTVASVYLVVTAQTPSALPPNVVYVSGYLLMLLLCGMLVYDGMLKTEHLFENLDRTLIVAREDEAAYRAFKERLEDDLRHTTRLPGVGDVPTYTLFAPLFVAQFAAVWLLQSGPQGLGWWLNLLLNVVCDLFVVVVAFQFLVLIKAFHDLVTGNADVEVDGEVRDDLLTYRPFHPDGRGGFRDLGKFATRVNVLLIVGGLYTIYRLYVQGGRSPVLEFGSAGTASALGIGGEAAPLVWLVSYAGPVLAYVLAAGAWLYYSFWQLHVKMAREREEQYTRHQRTRRERAETDAPIGDFDDAQQWHELRSTAPVWPIESRQLVSLVSGTVVPVLFSFQEFLL